MTSRPHVPRLGLARQFVAGLVVGIMTVSVALSLAALVFKGDLAPGLGRGAGWSLVGLVVIGTIAALTSSFPGVVAAPQSAPAVILGAAAAALAARADEPMASIAVFIIVASTFTGGLLIVMGRSRWGALVRYVPFPVVAGFLGGTGLVLVISGMETLVGSDQGAAEVWLRTIPGLVVGLLIVALSRLGVSAVAAPVIIVAAIGGYHAAAAAAGIDKAEGIARGLLLGPFPEGSLADPGVLAELWSADWGAVIGELPAMGAMALLVSLGLLLNVGGLEHSFNQDLDADRELTSTGLGMLAAAPFAGFPGYATLGSTVMGRRIGGVSRIPPLVAAGLAAVVLAAGPGLVSTLPVAIPGGLLLGLGVEFMLIWLWDVRSRVGGVEYAVVIVIVATVAVFGYLPGVALGIVAAVVIFVIRYSRIPAVRAIATGRDRRSNVQRSAAAEDALTEVGDRVVLVELQGFLFFGTAEQIVQSVREALRERPHVGVVIIDLRRVTGMDSSAATSFERLDRFAVEQQLEVVLCGANRTLRASLQPTLERSSIHYEVDVDHALESTEETLLGEYPAPEAAAPPFDDALWDDVPVIELAAGSVIITEGERGAGVFYLAAGRASVVPPTAEPPTADRARYRPAVLLPGSVIGELSYLTGKGATATVVCDTDCVFRHVSERWLADLAAIDPSRALELHHIVARRLAEKLTAANRTIRSLI